MSNPAFNDSFTWDTYDFLFDAFLQRIIVTSRESVAIDKYAQGYYDIFFYPFVDESLFISYSNGNIHITNQQEFSHYNSFREFLIMEKSGTYPSVTLFNGQASFGGGNPIDVVSLRTGGLGIVDVSDTDPVYYQMMSYELNRTSLYQGKPVQIKAVELSKGQLTRQNTFNGVTEDQTFNVLSFQIYYQ